MDKAHAKRRAPATLTPFRIQKFLGGLQYPVRKPRVIDHARGRGADAHVLRALEMLPECDFESPVELSRRVGEHALRHALRAPLKAL